MKSSSVLVLSAVALLGSLVFTSESVAQQPPSDANIGAIVLAANQIDIDYGKLALTKSKNKELVFAQQMVIDHGTVQKSVIELAGKLHLTPVENDTSNSLKAKSVEVTAKLKSLRGKTFDKFYIDNEVAYHKLVTDAIAGVLIPNAQNSELKAALQGAQTLFLGHLEHARNVQANVDPAATHDTGNHK
jgi:putative membrane protein